MEQLVMATKAMKVICMQQNLNEFNMKNMDIIKIII